MDLLTKKDIVHKMMKLLNKSDSVCWATLSRLIKKNPELKKTLYSTEDLEKIWVLVSGKPDSKKSVSRLVKAFDKMQTIEDWALDLRCKVKARCLYGRIFQQGWETERAITTPLLIEKKSFVTYKKNTRTNNKNRSIESGKEWLEKFKKENNLIELDKELRL